MRTFKIIFMGTLLLWLTGCATVSTPKNTPAQNPTQTWNDRVQTLSAIQTWDIKGLIAIRNNAKPDNVSANIQWQQSRKNYQLLLFGPLGAGAVTLKGSPQQVTLQTADGKTFHAASAEALLAEQTNWHLPVSNLFYWVRGIPAPGPAKKQLDNFHHLTLLQQQGWQIQYLDYTAVNQVDVPSKIILTNPDFYVKIIIKQWIF